MNNFFRIMWSASLGFVGSFTAPLYAEKPLEVLAQEWQMNSILVNATSLVDMFDAAQRTQPSMPFKTQESFVAGLTELQRKNNEADPYSGALDRAGNQMLDILARQVFQWPQFRWPFVINCGTLFFKRLEGAFCKVTFPEEESQNKSLPEALSSFSFPMGLKAEQVLPLIGERHLLWSRVEGSLSRGKKARAEHFLVFGKKPKTETDILTASAPATHSLTHSVSQSLSQSLTHSLTHSETSSETNSEAENQRVTPVTVETQTALRTKTLTVDRSTSGSGRDVMSKTQSQEASQTGASQHSVSRSSLLMPTMSFDGTVTQSQEKTFTATWTNTTPAVRTGTQINSHSQGLSKSFSMDNTQTRAQTVSQAMSITSSQTVSVSTYLSTVPMTNVTLTGLSAIVNSFPPANVSGLIWQETIMPLQMNQSTAIAACHQIGWRLPTIFELTALYRQHTAVVFAEGKEGLYSFQSSTHYSIKSLALDSGPGSVYEIASYSRASVWCAQTVSEPTYLSTVPMTNVTLMGDSAIVNSFAPANVSGLIWQETIMPLQMNQSTAIAACHQIGWRLPNIFELTALYRQHTSVLGGGAIFQSSSVYSTFGVALDFYDGTSFSLSAGSLCRVRCLR